MGAYEALGVLRQQDTLQQNTPRPLGHLMSTQLSPLFALGGTCMLGPNPMMRQRISEGLQF